MELQIKPDNKRKIRYFTIQRKLYVFFVCFILSSIIWILIKLSRDYTDTLRFPVSYTNIPSGKVLVNNPDSVLTLTLKSKGFRIFYNKLFFKPQTISIDVASLIRKKKNSKEEYFILTSDIYQLIGKQIHYPNGLISANPDTLYFRFLKMYSKKIPVKLNLNLDFVRQYELAAPIKHIPDSVLVGGIKAIIDTIKFAETESKTISNINDNQSFSLVFAQKYHTARLKIVPDTEKVILHVEKFTEASVELPVNIVNNVNRYVIKTFPENINVYYTVSHSNLKNVNASMFNAVIDISAALTSKSKNVKVEIDKYPSFVKIKKVEPEKIEYLILK